MTKIVTAMGRKFETSDEGFLLDLQGNPTTFKTMDLELKMESQPRCHMQRFPEAQANDTIAYANPVTQGSLSGNVAGFDHILLIRDGRMAAASETHFSSIMFD